MDAAAGDRVGEVGDNARGTPAAESPALGGIPAEQLLVAPEMGEAGLRGEQVGEFGQTADRDAVLCGAQGEHALFGKDHID